MKSFIRNIALVLLIISCCQSSFAQLQLDFQLRPRLEMRHGYRTLPTADAEHAFFVRQRSRLNATLKMENIDIYLSLQDVRTWGDESQLQDVSSVGIHQAWAQWHMCDKLSLKLGRQELVYDDHRILGNVDWTPQARSHDAAVFQWRPGSWQIDAGGAFNQRGEPLFGRDYMFNNYKVLSYLWVHKSLSKHFDFSVIGLADGSEVPDSTRQVTYRQTIGTDLNFKHKSLKLHGSAYYQMGMDVQYNDISAFLFNIDASIKRNNWTFGIGTDYLSGTDASLLGGETHTFNTLYATNHKFYGHMDYFLNLPDDTQDGGLMDLYGKVQWNNSPWLATLDFHYFQLTADIVDPVNFQMIDPGLGAELDFSMGYNINSFAQLKGGYSILFPTSSMVSIKGGTTDVMAHWAWVMLNVQPAWIFKINEKTN